MKPTRQDYLVSCWVQPFRGVGEPEPAWEMLRQFVVTAGSPELAHQQASQLEPVIRRSSWLRLGQVRFDIETIEQLRGFYGTLVRALKDPCTAIQPLVPSARGERS